MATVAVLLFVALAVMPVAASVWPSNNNTYVPIANQPPRFPYQNATGYYFNLTNTSPNAGQNAIHITNDNSSFAGGIYSSQPTSGTFYVSDTGGRGGQDDILLLVAVNSTDFSDIRNFAINITSSGYTWTPTTSGSPPGQASVTYNPVVLNATPFTSHDYLKSSGSYVFQIWKFAPTANYPIFNGQDLTTDGPFKLILIDLKVGTIGNRTAYYPNLNKFGMAEVDYNITSSPSTRAIIAFNAYAYNNQTVQGVGINWLNQVNTNLQSSPTASGLVVSS